MAIPDNFFRLPVILYGDPSANPPRPPFVPVCKAAWYRGIKSGRYPAPVKLGRVSVWRASDIYALIAQK